MKTLIFHAYEAGSDGVSKFRAQELLDSLDTFFSGSTARLETEGSTPSSKHTITVELAGGGEKEDFLRSHMRDGGFSCSTPYRR